jgi:tryptophanyl-tRNA synthetase
MRARRKAYEADIPGVYKILQEGSKKAEAKAAETLFASVGLLGINYFADQETD